MNTNEIIATETVNEVAPRKSLEDCRNEREIRANGYEFDESMIEGLIIKAIKPIVNLQLSIEIVGSWIWVGGDTKPHKEVLKSVGYIWNSKRKLWQFATVISYGRGKKDMELLRAKYGRAVVKTND